jgi:hypothetical protein
MPNHVTNILTVKGRKEDVKKVFDQIRSDGEDGDHEKYIDFNKIIPMPEELQVASGSSEDKAKMIVNDCGRKKNTIREYMEKHKKTLEESTIQYLNNFLKYGYSSWYNWAYDKWGTKWNAYTQERISDDQITFETAWASPYPVIAELSRQHPKVKITVEYADEDIGSNCGYYIVQNGEDVSTYTPHGKTAEKYACQIKGYDYYEYRAEQEQDS